MVLSEPPIIAITMGDPSGIGPELAVLGATALSRSSDRGSALIVGDLRRLELASAILKKANHLSGAPDLVPVSDPATALTDNQVAVWDLHNVPEQLPWGTVSEEAGRAGFDYLKEAVRLAMDHRVAAICTAPIHKKAWDMAGIPFPGHTEALAQLSGTSEYAMMLRNQRLRVVHATTHIPFNQIITRLTSARIVMVCRLATEYLAQIGVLHPSIAVAGLNPHAGDNGLFGDEEQTIIQPAIEAAQQEGWSVEGPFPADTIFARASQGEFDMVVALYHDQGHIAIKMLGLDTGVNETIGLPIIRTSVDHGTAFDIAGQGLAREESMNYAIQAALDDANAWGNTRRDS